MSTRKLAFVAAEGAEVSTLNRLERRYGNCVWDEAEVLVVLGGDGTMLNTLHKIMAKPVPIFGMNCGTVGFLMNRFEENDLLDRIDKARKTALYPLLMRAHDGNGIGHQALAINEVSLLRQTGQAAKISIWIDGVERLPELICDGVMLATPAGSTAYNLSAHGPILPIGAGVLALTPVSPFRPRRWRGAVLPHRAEVKFVVQEPAKRPVSATADFNEFRDVREVVITEDRDRQLTLLFDPGHNLEERILREQFET